MGFPLDFSQMSMRSLWYFYDVSMGFLWDFCGVSMICLLDFYGFLWHSYGSFHHGSMIFL